MMDSPFFRTQWNQPSRPRYSPIVRGVPVQPVQQKPVTTPSPKVVSIPVHFVGSERQRSASALKIQKVFRGFLVRKSMKKIASIKKEVDEIEWRILRGETIELIRKEPKERLRINETLMALLLKLDSVRGVDSGVRDCRKAVIKKAIALQEKVDAIVAAADREVDQILESKGSTAEDVDQTLEVEGAVDETLETEAVDQTIDTEAVDQTIEIKDSTNCLIDTENVADQNPEFQGNALDGNDSSRVLIDCSFDCNNCSDQTLESVVLDQSLEIKDSTNCLIDNENVADQTPEFQGNALDVNDSSRVLIDFSFDCNNCSDQILETESGILEFEDPANCFIDINDVDKTIDLGGIDETAPNSGGAETKEDGVYSVIENVEMMDIPESGVGVRTEVSADEEEPCVVKEIVENRNSVEGVETSLTENCSEYSANTRSVTEEAKEKSSEKLGGDMKGCLGNGHGDDSKGNRELTERMIEDNEKMMKLVTQLFKRNEMQTRLLTGLTQRVEQLERAFICDKLRRKKKRAC